MVHVQTLYIYAPYQLARAAIDVDARLGCARAPIGMQFFFIAKYGCHSQLRLSMRYAQSTASQRDVPTYSTAIRRPHHIVVLELEVLVKHGLVELHFSVEFVADFFPVGCWLGHGWSQLSG